MNKIVFYISSINRAGGAEKVFSIVVNNLKNYNWEIVVVSDFRAEHEHKLNNSIKRVVLLNKKFKNKIIRNWLIIYRLIKVIKLETPQITISFLNENNIRLIISKFFTGIKSITSVRNDFSRLIRNPIKKLLYSKLYKFTDLLVFQTKGQKSYFSKVLQKKSMVIKNPIDNIFIETMNVTNPSNIISIGRFVEQKNHKLLIKAFAKIANKVKDNLVIYGDGPLRFEYMELIKTLGLTERILLPGFIYNIHLELKKAKLFVLSSDYEGQPNSLMEAMAIGVPCISTKASYGITDLIDNNVNGLLVEKNDVENLAYAILDLIRNSGLRKKIGDEGRKKLFDYRTSIIGCQWNQIIKKVINR